MRTSVSWRSSVRAEVWENHSGGGMERNLGVEARKQVRKLSRGQMRGSPRTMAVAVGTEKKENGERLVVDKAREVS